MLTLHYDILNDMSYYLSTFDILSLANTCKYLANYYKCNKLNLLKKSLRTDTGIITDNYNLKSLCILLGNHMFGQKRISYVYPNVVVTNKRINKIVSDNSYIVRLYSNRVEIYEALNRKLIKTVNGRYTDIATHNSNVMLLSENNIMDAFNENSFSAKNIRQIEIYNSFLFWLDNIGNLYAKHLIINQRIGNIIKFYYIGDNLVTALLFDETVIEFNILDDSSTRLVMSNIIDMYIYEDNISVFLDRSGNVYIKGHVWNTFYKKYINPDYFFEVKHYVGVNTPLQILELVNIIAIYVDGERLVTMDKDHKVKILNL